jgi:membrane protease YdiL (CAAX protease family)
MLERMTPYIWFFIVAVAFMVVGSLLQIKLPAQGALIVAEVVCMLGFALLIQRQWGKPGPMPWPNWRALGASAKSTPLWSAPLFFGAGALFGVTANAIGGLVTITVPGMQEQAQQYAERVEQMLAPGDPVVAVLAILSVSVFAPLCEEAFFRGTLLPVQREHEPTWMAILFNGLLFSLLHMNAPGALSLALLGCAMAYLTVRSGSIWPAILCHAGVNTFNGVILPRYAEHAGVDMTNIEPEWTEVLLLLAVTLPLSAVVIWWLGERLLGGKEVAKQAAEN